MLLDEDVSLPPASACTLLPASAAGHATRLSPPAPPFHPLSSSLGAPTAAPHEEALRWRPPPAGGAGGDGGAAAAAAVGAHAALSISARGDGASSHRCAPLQEQRHATAPLLPWAAPPQPAPSAHALEHHNASLRGGAPQCASPTATATAFASGCRAGRTGTGVSLLHSTLAHSPHAAHGAAHRVPEPFEAISRSAPASVYLPVGRGGAGMRACATSGMHAMGAVAEQVDALAMPAERAAERRMARSRAPTARASAAAGGAAAMVPSPPPAVRFSSAGGTLRVRADPAVKLAGFQPAGGGGGGGAATPVMGSRCSSR